MTDREQLELAAKAAGIEIKVSEVDGTTLYTRDSSVGWRIWNPRDDEGDALRLAVKIKWVPSRIEFEKLAVQDDPYAATRRAIVRAAAEIGRNMK